MGGAEKVAASLWWRRLELEAAVAMESWVAEVTTTQGMGAGCGGGRWCGAGGGGGAEEGVRSAEVSREWEVSSLETPSR